MDEKKARRRIVIEETGETRVPKIGEWTLYSSMDDIHYTVPVHRQAERLTSPYPIVTLTVEDAESPTVAVAVAVADLQREAARIASFASERLNRAQCDATLATLIAMLDALKVPHALGGAQ